MPVYPYSSDFITPNLFSRVCILSHTTVDSMVVLASAATATLLSEQICAPQGCHHVSLKHRSTFPVATHFLFPYLSFLARLNNVVLFGNSLLARKRRKALRTEVLIAKYWPTMNTRSSCEKNHIVDYRITAQLAVNKLERRQRCSGWGKVLMCLFQYLYTSALWAACNAVHSLYAALK